VSALAAAFAWMRARPLLMCAIAAAVVVTGAGFALAVAANEPPAPVVQHAANHNDHETSGPVVEVPPDVNGPGTGPRLEQIPTTTTVPTAGAEAKEQASESNAVRRGEVTVVTTPVSAGAGNLAPVEEAKSDLPRSSAALPATIAFPAGTKIALEPRQFANGVVQWLYTNDTVAFDQMLAAMHTDMTSNGWRITAEPARETLAIPGSGTGPIMRQQIYVANGSVRGYLIVSTRGNQPGSQVQIDLLGV